MRTMRIGRRKPTMADRVKPWFAIDGDRTLRLDYDLTPESVVVDAGGYEGQWASDLFSRYLCQMLIFEPMPEFAARIEQRFALNPHVRVFPVGLAGSDRIEKISVAGDASSIFGGRDARVEIELKAAVPLLRSLGVGPINLFKINIEGGEYELLEHLLDEGVASNIENIQVQFHDFVPDAEFRMRALQHRLATTHDLTYQFEFVWENWRLRD